ncbi:hypothetical protein, partial [Salmonella enterica]|uniref:hypothetical protein n=1 Tax=Salmonella enterica TaxID=28901 RepID=UPI003F804CA7
MLIHRQNVFQQRQAVKRLAFHFTQNGWVQSYGSRCVKPPVVIGDISRPAPITVEWAKYAQSLT